MTLEVEEAVPIISEQVFEENSASPAAGARGTDDERSIKVVHEESSIPSFGCEKYFFSPFTVFAVCIALLTVAASNTNGKFW
jgi:hypothetical protein